MDIISIQLWFGYLASVVVAVSLMMKSIVKLRWYNLFGAGLFSAYGFWIGALPVGVLNLFIALCDVYYLYQMKLQKEYFQVLQGESTDSFLSAFIKFYQAEIKKIFPDFEFSSGANIKVYYILRNLVPAGILLVKEIDSETLSIELDFVSPAYRDLKVGQFIFIDHEFVFAERGYKKLITLTKDKKHVDYLYKMGFVKLDENSGMMIKNLKPLPFRI